VEGVVSLEPPRSDVLEIVRATERALASLAGRRILIAGAGGFLGSYLCHAIALANDEVLRKPCNIVCLDTFVTGTPERLASLVDRSDVALISTSLSGLERLDCDVAVHAASIASPPIYRQRPLETVDINVLGTWTLLRHAYAENAASVLFLSSSEVYGDPVPEAIPTNEDYVGRVSFTGPRACYDESKRLAETLCRLFYEQHGVPVKVARPFNVYGPGLRLDDGRVVPDFVQQGLRGGPLVLHSDGTPTRSFCYVTDATVAFLELLCSGEDGEAFNVGTPEEVSMRTLAEGVAAQFGHLEIMNRRSDDAAYLVGNPQRRCPDTRKIRERIGWTPRVSLAEGLRRTVEFYRAPAFT
jgi:dTDP-glucose 4,6-dehydratase/UDP-glucuronate decarboxylase